MTSSYNDGSANAPAGTPLLPALLNGYATTPPWEVAGVNYAVGVPAGTALQDPTKISMAGVSVNASSHTVTITGSNVTLSGYDFTQGGGWGVYINSGVSNTVIENSHFLVGANNKVPIDGAPGSGNLTVRANTLDGGSSQSGAVWALLQYSGTGTLTAQYNAFLNAAEDAIDLNSGTMTTNIDYNVFENIGTSPGAHPDPVQYVGVNSVNSVEAFNTIYQPNQSGEQGVQVQAQNGSTLTNTTIENNTIVAKGPGIDMSYSIAVIQNSGNTINGATVEDNYIDYKGAYGPIYPPSGSNLVYGGNVNLSTGAAIPNPSGTTSGAPAPIAVSSVTASPASGTETPGTKISITLTFSQTATVTGTPTLSLNDGGTATYASGSGSSKLVFTYTVGSSDKAVAALGITAVNLPNGAKIAGSGGTAANLAGAVTSFPGLAIGAAAPQPQPVAAADTASTPENKAVSIAVLANDSAGGGTIAPNTVAVSTAAGHGTTSVNTTTGAITYTPATGFTGTDTFKYTVADTDGVASAPATVTVSVAAATVTPPTAVADTATTPENQAVAISVLANDSDAGGTINPASVAVGTAAQHGATAVNTSTGAITYTPATGFTGTDTFKYTVADTKGVASAAATVTVTVTPPQTTGGSSGYVDGSSGAPAGSPQLPSILSGYTAPPPWKVAGVNYAVGVASGTTLLDPSKISMAGVSVNASNHTVTITGNNVTLSGYNFGIGNGYEVIVQGANDAIRNSSFVVGSDEGSMGTVLNVANSASNFSLIGNEINGNNVAVTAQQGSTIMAASSGTLTMQYNYFHNSGGDMIDLNASSAPQIDLFQYNLFANIGVNTAHADTIQWYNTTTGAGSDIGFNTVYQNVNQPGPGNGALVPLAEGPKATMTGLTVNNNTIIQTAADTQANFSTGFYADEGGSASNIVIHDNYVDPTGVMGYTGSPWFPTGHYGDNLPHPSALSNLINMKTGAAIPVPSSSSKTSQGYYTYADGSGYTPALSDVYSVKTSPASGTYDPGATITITVNLDENFTVTGTPTLTLNNGGTATYSGGSGTSALTFRYTVGNADTTVTTLAVKAVNLPGGATVKDSVGNAANLAGAVTSFPGLAIDPPGPGATTTPATPVATATPPVTGTTATPTAANTYDVTAATIGALSLPAGTSGATLVVNGGGDVTMGGGLSGIAKVQLTAPTHFTANSTDGLQIAGSSAGGDTITLGSPTQAVTGGGADERIIATAANAGARISGLGTNSTLEVTSGGSIHLNAATDVTTVQLDAAGTLVLNGMSFITATGVAGGDTIQAGGANQVLSGGLGSNTLVGSDAGHDIFRNTAAGLDGDTIKAFLRSDTIDATDLAFSGATLQTKANGGDTTLTLASGSTTSTFTLDGTFGSRGFHLASDGNGGTLITHGALHA